ncbi:hypothetical protein [Crossiella sp. NPDC003009]
MHQELETQLTDWKNRVTVLQDMIEQRIESILKRVSAAFHRLDEERGGCGAQIAFVPQRPQGPGEWAWEVVPRWKRSRSGAFVPYREVANGAQVKVYAVQLVLAALLSDVETHGRVLVLDELGNSLGEVNRKDVLGEHWAAGPYRKQAQAQLARGRTLAEKLAVDRPWFAAFPCPAHRRHRRGPRAGDSARGSATRPGRPAAGAGVGPLRCQLASAPNRSWPAAATRASL